MIVLLSPAKSLDYESAVPELGYTNPRFLDASEKLVAKLKKMKPAELRKLMSISEDLAQLNATRFSEWKQPMEQPAARQAIFAFTGDVYQGFDAKSLKKEEIEFAQNTLRILSGLYGVLRPLDLMLPYRLEMGSALKVSAAADNLYKFWGDKLAKSLVDDLQSHDEKVIINLASNEYFKSVKPGLKGQKIITPEFREAKNGEYKMIGFFAKKARGMMARYIVQHALTNAEDIKGFDQDGYVLNRDLSGADKWVFTRG